MMHPITNTAHLNQQGPGVSRSVRLADFFRYHGLWAPGVRLFRRLRFRAKALILSAMFIIPIALLSWQYFGDKLALIEFTKGERLGVQALTHFIEVQHGLVRLRAAQTAMAQGLSEAGPVVDDARAQVDAGLDRLKAQASEGRDSMNLKPLVTDVIQRWQSMPSADDPELQASIKALLDHIGDASGLVLDPDLDSFYLMKAVVFTLPGAMDDLGHLWTWGTHATIKAGLGTEQERRWQLWTAGLTEAEEELQHAYSRASSHNTALRQQVTELNLQKGLALAVRGEQAVFGEGGVQPPSFFQDGQSATTDLKSMYLRTLPMLDELLAQREIRLRQAALGTALVLIISLLVVWYLFLSFRKVLEGGLNEVAYHIDEMRAGNLTTDPRAWGHDEAARLMITLKDMQASLRLVVSQVRDAAETIVHASREIASGSSDLSNRTAQSAERLQLSASAMETVSATVEQTAQSAAQASKLAGTNAQAATDGGQIIHSVINTMSEIQDASRQIHEIVGTIDSIAFQTNILALNAAVEAARAGEQGRGFAVVASEVRALAQRTSTAAREVKRLIGSSVGKVDAGGAVVREAGQSMQHIVTHAQQVNDLLTEIASGARDQATGVQQTAQAVQALEDATQQNASLVEQTAAAAASLREQAQRLVDGVAVFKLG